MSWQVAHAQPAATQSPAHGLFIQLNYSWPVLGPANRTDPEAGVSKSPLSIVSRVSSDSGVIHASLNRTIKLKMRLSRTCQSIYSAACVAFVRIIGPRIIYVQFAVR